MPTTITAQNGAVITQQTKIPVLGCTAVKANKAKKLTRAQKLKAALKACRKEFRHSKQKRGSCEAKAHKRFGVKKKGARKSSGRGAGR